MKAVISVVSIIGLAVLLEGVLFLIKPGALKVILRFFAKGRNLYIAGAIRIVLGIVFLYYAQSCRISWLILVLGIVLCVSGLAFFGIKIEKLKAILNWWEQRSTITLRIIAIATVAIGAVLIYAGSPQ